VLQPRLLTVHRCCCRQPLLPCDSLTTAHAHTIGIASRKPYSAPAHAASSAGGRNMTVNHTYRRPKMIRPAIVCSWIHSRTLCKLSLRPRVKEVARKAPAAQTAQQQERQGYFAKQASASIWNVIKDPRGKEGARKAPAGGPAQQRHMGQANTGAQGAVALGGGRLNQEAPAGGSSRKQQEASQSASWTAKGVREGCSCA
jgi:hypothetical protein